MTSAELLTKINKTVASKAAFDAKMTSIGINPPVKFSDYATRIAGFDGYDVEGTSTFAGIPNGVTSIRKYVLSGMTNVTALTIPAAVTTFDTNAFSESSLSQVTMTGRTRGQTVTIPNFAFGLGDTVTFHCTDGDFHGARYIASGTTALPANHFKNNTTVKMCVLPDTCTSTGTSSYEGCTGLTAAVFPTNFTTIGSATFKNCTALTTVTPNAGMTTISDNAFNGCTAMTSYTCNNALTSIGASAFYGCNHLSSFKFGTGATAIGASAFSYCSALKSLTIPAAIPSTGIGANALQSSGLENVTMTGRTMAQTSAMSNYPWGLTAWSNMFTCSDGRAYGDGWTWGNANPTATPTKSGTTLTIGSTVGTIQANAYTGDTTIFDVVNNSYCLTSIGANAFKNCTMIETFTAGSQDTHDRQNTYTIGESAFQGCTSMTAFTNSLASGLGKSCFMGCTLLTSVVFNKALSVGESAFSGCTGLTSFSADNATSIGNKAFYGCTNLSTFSFQNITSIGSEAFVNTGLSSSQIQFSNKTVGDYAFIGINADGGTFSFTNCPKMAFGKSVADAIVMERDVSLPGIPPTTFTMNPSTNGTIASLTISGVSVSGTEQSQYLWTDRYGEPDYFPVWNPILGMSHTSVSIGYVMFQGEAIYNRIKFSGRKISPEYTAVVLPEATTIGNLFMSSAKVGTLTANSVSTIRKNAFSSAGSCKLEWRYKREDKCTLNAISQIGHLITNAIITTFEANCLSCVSHYTNLVYSKTQMRNLANYPWGMSSGTTITCKDGDITVGS